MLLNKTDKARAALRERPSELDARARRILILCDGRRGLDELTRLLGPDILTALTRLREAGYLEAAERERPLAASLRHATRELLGAEGATPPAAPRPATVTPAVVPKPAATPGTAARARPASRRSLAASRMYMLDMLQLQRSAEAAALRVELQTATGDEQVVAQVLQAFRYIRAQAAASYATRVGERLAETLPEPYLPQLRAALAATTDSAAA